MTSYVHISYKEVPRKLSELTRHIVAQKNNEKTKKKQHARLPAQMPVSGVSRSPGGSGRTQCQAKKTGNIKQTVARARQEHEEEKGGGQYGLPQRVGAKRPWCLGSEEPSVPSYAGQNDVKASVDNTCRKLRVFFAALMVTTKHQLLRDTDRNRYETHFFRFLLIRALRSFHVILRFFGFYPNYFLFGLLISSPSSSGTSLCLL